MACVIKLIVTYSDHYRQRANIGRRSSIIRLISHGNPTSVGRWTLSVIYQKTVMTLSQKTEKRTLERFRTSRSSVSISMERNVTSLEPSLVRWLSHAIWVQTPTFPSSHRPSQRRSRSVMTSKDSTGSHRRRRLKTSGWVRICSILATILMRMYAVWNWWCSTAWVNTGSKGLWLISSNASRRTRLNMNTVTRQGITYRILGAT